MATKEAWELGALLLTELVAQIAVAPPESVVMFSGAGVSKEGPASLPTGPELIERVFGAFFEDNALSTVLRHHAAVGWWSADPCRADKAYARLPRLPRLETVLSVAAAAFGHQAVTDILSDARDARPNRIHRFFAAHLAQGGRHVTANFDTCIEKALLEHVPGRRDEGQVFHFHGSFADDPSGAALGATLDRIQGGFDPAMAARFLRSIPTRGILTFLGYSGSDFFDVDTAMGTLEPGTLTGLRVIWVSHSDAAWRRVDPTSAAVPPVTGHLWRAGAEVDVVCGPTSELIRGIAEQWRLPAVGEPVPRVLQTPATLADEAVRRAATWKLYRELGLHDEIAAILRSGRVPEADPWAAWQARSELLWEQGRWATLRRMWWRGRTQAFIASAVRAERIGACLWVQGRLLPAYLWLTYHRRRCQHAGDRLMLAETEGRVIEHMARTPELRPLARRLAPAITDILGETGQRAGVHTYRRRNDLTSSLRSVSGLPRGETEAATSSLWFTEAGNLLASLSYRHRQYRDTYDGSQIGDTELARRYRELQAQYDSIGSPSGKWRTHLLPGAERVFGTWEFLMGLFAMQYGWWHRTRLLAHYLSLRIGHRFRTTRNGHEETAARSPGERVA